MNEERHYDLSFLNKISGGDESFILEMVTTFSEVAPDYLAKAKKYLEEKKYLPLSKETHRFIPGVSFLGIKNLEEELLKIEDYSKRNVQLDDIPQLLSKVEEIVLTLLSEFNTDFKLDENSAC
jgi:HPt (histidine-containing phosphotransfer) domain-containing protein